MSCVLTVNVAHPRANPAKPSVTTGIVKVPADGEVTVRSPGPQPGGLGSGLESDTIGNRRLHGGDDQAVYAYAREDLDAWQTRLGRTLDNGNFGENFTTSGVDVTHAVIGERWQVGTAGLLLEVTSPRTPCKTFEAWLEVPGLIKTFTDIGEPGAYLRVINPGTVRAGDAIVVTDRPAHGITVQTVFRALLREPALLDSLRDIVDTLPADIRRKVQRREARSAS